MDKTTLATLVVVITAYAALQTFVAYQYEVHNDALNFSLGRCIGVNSMKRVKP